MISLLGTIIESEDSFGTQPVNFSTGNYNHFYYLDQNLNIKNYRKLIKFNDKYCKNKRNLLQRQRAVSLD